ncbi:fluoride export protein 1-like [Rhododendron vialii]|uniref:fluoride export protein 1-like n=1 Tax=Rhododendron vialii TaxID=182163 RepID=UPI00265FE6A8|nr:fluoride export protein 1-like [Rhododendron vialii]XP_058219888.1 fluoride export protein 1-like [Rhododendron vialii]
MDLETNRADSFVRRHSFSSSNAITPIDDDRHDIMENSSVMPIPVDALATTSIVSPSPSTSELTSPLSTEGIIHSNDKNNENKKELPWVLDYGSQLIHLAVFGILGVLTRYLLQKLFGPGVVGLTSDQTVLYLDLPSNMVGSFLMGWFGIVFKGDISRVSDYLAVGLATGYLGSLTTFSGWNQKMLDLSVQGKWALVVFGYPIGFILADYAIIYGVRTAQGFKRFLETSNVLPKSEISSSQSNWKVDNFKCQFAFMLVLILMLGLLWGVSGALERREFDSGGSGAQLWLACIVGPFGVWLRWFLACRLNGRGIGLHGLLKWVPFGTLIANVSAACVMAGLATLMKVVKTKTCNTIATGIQFGLLGSLSTVSSFVSEVHLLRESKKPWRGDVYAVVTIVVSFGLGTLIYSVPVWTHGYD